MDRSICTVSTTLTPSNNDDRRGTTPSAALADASARPTRNSLKQIALASSLRIRNFRLVDRYAAHCHPSHCGSIPFAICPDATRSSIRRVRSCDRLALICSKIASAILAVSTISR